jgi:hypothetical protein
VLRQACIAVDEGEFLYHEADRFDRSLSHGIGAVEKSDMRPKMLRCPQADPQQRAAKPMVQRYQPRPFSWKDQCLSSRWPLRNSGESIERYFKGRKGKGFRRPLRREDGALGHMPMIA